MLCELAVLVVSDFGLLMNRLRMRYSFGELSVLVEDQIVVALLLVLS